MPLNVLFNGIPHYEAVDRGRACLPPPVDAVYRLGLHRRIQKRLKDEHVIRFDLQTRFWGHENTSRRRSTPGPALTLSLYFKGTACGFVSKGVRTRCTTKGRGTWLLETLGRFKLHRSCQVGLMPHHTKESSYAFSDKNVPHRVGIYNNGSFKNRPQLRNITPWLISPTAVNIGTQAQIAQVNVSGNNQLPITRIPEIPLLNVHSWT